ncbi:glycosyltransferase family 2 protein [Flaviaesturariibacter terrae]
MNVIAFVVTYNRLPLLKECIAGLLAQTRCPDAILVINNASTDGTAEWLATQPVDVITQPNRGGSWGFYTGIREAYARGADWTWLMDDDTIPTATALEELLRVAEAVPGAGFCSSKAEWTDGTPHVMNLPDLRVYALGTPFNRYDATGALTVLSSTFVSLLLNRRAVEKEGLPLKEFFIWTDDHEYTDRIARGGMPGLYVARSVVLHKTPLNHGSNIFEDEPRDLWKYRHGLRNELYFIRTRQGAGKYRKVLLKRLFVFPIRILRKRKAHRWAFIKVVWQTAIASLSFRPVADRV